MVCPNVGSRERHKAGDKGFVFCVPRFRDFSTLDSTTSKTKFVKITLFISIQIIFGLSSTVQKTMNESRVEELMGQMVGHMTGSMVCLGVWLGDELGLYKVMRNQGPQSADEVAVASRCHPRLVREWLDGQAAGGLIEFDAEVDRYSLTDEAAAVLADETQPTFVARAMNALGSFYMNIEKVKTAFKGDGAIAWGDHHPCLFRGTEWFFRPGYRTFLCTEWIPSLNGVDEKLKVGGRVADVGCGHGASIIAMAKHYSNATFSGFDYHAPSIETSRLRARDEGLENRTRFEVADAKSYEGNFDLICFFDCLHDMGDPVGIARHAREHLADGGSVLMVEPFALDSHAKNIAENPMATLLYNASTCVCTPNSLSQEVGLGLGAQAGEERLRDVFLEAGFSSFERCTETPLNLVFQAKS